MLNDTYIKPQRKFIKHFAEDCLEELEEFMMDKENPFEALQVAMCMNIIRRKLSEWGCDDESGNPKQSGAKGTTIHGEKP